MIECDTVITVNGVSKKFCKNLRSSILYGLRDALKDMAGVSSKRDALRANEFWALKDISFTLRKGDVVGVLGRNGAGKSTLLRILSGIYPPDVGTVEVKGRIGALIALGAGFHPDMTGRENIFLNGSLIGTTRAKIFEKLDEIISFAEIGDFIDSPVSTYSSGMTVRLGFSIAIHCAPEVIIADEVLAVGDLQFALKCYRKISDYRSSGGTILLVSHSLQQVRNFCNQAIWIEGGQIVDLGSCQDVCNSYEKLMFSRAEAEESRLIDESASSNVLNYDPKCRVTSVDLLDESFRSSRCFKSGDPILIRIGFRCERKVNEPIFTVSIFNAENIQIISNYTNFDGYKIDSILGMGHIDFKIENLHLKSGLYKCMLTFAEENDVNRLLEWHEKGYPFSVEPTRNPFFGLINPLPTWSLGSHEKRVDDISK